VSILIVLDRGQQGRDFATADIFANQGIPVYIDAKHEAAHNKVMIIDAQLVITGSFNFSAAAEEKNAENLLVIHHERIAATYAGNFAEHLKHSLRYRR